MQPRIAFIHIPKCAGTSVGSSIRRTYFPRRQRWFARVLGAKRLRLVNISAQKSLRTADDLGKPLAEVRATLLHYHLQDETIGYLSGHVPFTNEIGRTFEDDWQFVTVVRAPIDRFVSEYLYNRHKSQDHFSILDGLKPFLESPEAVRIGSQLVNFLTGRHDVCQTPTDDDVREACQNLERFTVIGRTEKLDRFASDMAARFGRRPNIPHTNRTPAPDRARASIEDPTILRRIGELSQADTHVYQQAVRLIGE